MRVVLFGSFGKAEIEAGLRETDGVALTVTDSRDNVIDALPEAEILMKRPSRRILGKRRINEGTHVRNVLQPPSVKNSEPPVKSHSLIGAGEPANRD